MYVEIDPPIVWRKLGERFYQGSFENNEDFYHLLDDFWSSILNSEKVELLEFIEHLLNDNLPGGMQKKYWRLSGADMVPHKIELFLGEILSRFEALNNG